MDLWPYTPTLLVFNRNYCSGIVIIIKKIFVTLCACYKKGVITFHKIHSFLFLFSKMSWLSLIFGRHYIFLNFLKYIFSIQNTMLSRKSTYQSSTMNFDYMQIFPKNSLDLMQTYSKLFFLRENNIGFCSLYSYTFILVR